jgi:hypothetical protein
MDMDSVMQLALMSKAKKVFGANDTFLSFPVSPLPHTKRQLDFFAQQDADAVRESTRNLQAFSTLVNLIPSDEAWLPTETRFLWDVYGEMLKDADFASSTRTPEEEAAYQQARGYLGGTPEGGAREDSAPVKAYRQYKDAYLLAQQNYLAAKGTAECAIDPAEQKRWQEDEPAWRAELDALRAKWIIEGHKNEVEAAQSKVVSLGARSPHQTWEEWNSRFNPDLDTQTGAADNFTFFPSLFSPSNALDEGAWKPFKLTQEEVTVLLNEVPAELRARFGADSVSSSVKSVTFEFSSAAILRPWFVSEAFRTRFWRFADPSRIISDGGIPPKGTCPAYVTAIVFARRVAIEEQQAAPIPGAKSFDGFRFTMAVRDQERLARLSPEVLTPTQPRIVNLDAPTINVGAAAEAMSPRTADLRMTKPPLMRAVDMTATVARPVTAQGETRHPLRLNAVAVTRLPQYSVLGTTLSAATSPPEMSPPTTPDDAIYILAFICKALPKTPDPDLTLQW